MGAHSFEDLKRHVGHEIHCVAYGPEHEYEGDLANVAVECETCNEVLMDFDRPEGKEAQEPMTADCKFCWNEVSINEAHLHKGSHVCDECWDDRLKTTE